MARVDFDQMAAEYQRARSLTLEGLAGWREALAAYLPAEGDLPVLDLGAGTSMFASAIAGWFDVDVVAVEPSAGMRAQARQRYPHPRVAQFADLPHCARALREALPAPAESAAADPPQPIVDELDLLVLRAGPG